MKISFEYRNPTPLHCDIAIFINGAFTGTLRLRQDELGSLEQIIAAGVSRSPSMDAFVSRGNPDPMPKE